MPTQQGEDDMSQLFLPLRGFCARKDVGYFFLDFLSFESINRNNFIGWLLQIKVKEVVLEETDICKAIVNCINACSIQNIVLGASSRISLIKKFRSSTDLATNVTKLAPDFCAVYVIQKGRPATIRSAKSPPPPPPPPSGYVAVAPGFLVSQDQPTTATAKMALRQESLDLSPRPSAPRDCSSGDSESGFQSVDSGTSETSSNFNDPSGESLLSPSSTAGTKDLEAEMKKLKLELKHTMAMYSTACKEAVTAKQKAKELYKWKLEESRRVEVAKHAEEAALAVAEMEKAKCIAALEMARAAQRIAEQEAIRRRNAEMRAKQEAAEKNKALSALTHGDVIHYRRYNIEEIELATEGFSEELKVGEGGYGPVYRACLDHTLVAIKVLRPDAAHGRSQFQQEVYLLSCIRHPNMVLLLGACPEYGSLVYEYMENGSLEDRLFRRGGTPPLPWPLRFKISAEIATGLLFFHQSKPEPIVHRDLKPANVLLDRNFVSKISDVGLARLVPAAAADQMTQYRMTATAGTFCYIDPEYQKTGMLGTKSDVYSLGVLLLQIVTARPPMGLARLVERAIERGDFVGVLDPTVTDWPMEETLGFARLALKCAELRRKDRPDLGMVVLPELNRLRNLGIAYESSDIRPPAAAGDGAQTLTAGHQHASSHVNQV
ncbi:U-box domain-containing protein 34-like isoform X2 [Zingiber officinale]|uniref:U-box domain-containing protein 34-like isoform X2 n=1 Tax=Zingiber officinale TaxID=94328 RepID=UPI001C4B25CE|nr:U-box domain-containing protein 34-like isoform X2 [Zingiber officinale]